MTKCASSVGWAASSSVSTLTPANQVSNFDQVVTQWMAPRYSDGGSRCASSQVHVVGFATLPSTLMLHVSGVIRGVGSAVRTGQSLPTSYWPGGSRGSRSRLLPRNPRVAPVMALSLPARPLLRGALHERCHFVFTWLSRDPRPSFDICGDDSDAAGPTTDPADGEDQLGLQEGRDGGQRDHH